MIHLGGSDFETPEGTFKAIQRDDEVYFDLGVQEKKKKNAIYRNGTIAMDIRSPAPRSRLPNPSNHACRAVAAQRGTPAAQTGNRGPNAAPCKPA
jgi:hypothetical protein